MKRTRYSMHSAMLLMVLILACTPKEKLDSQAPRTPQATIRKMPPGNCEDCDLMYKGIPKTIHSIDTSRGWNEPGQKLIIKGHVYKKDLKTPASDVVLYYYHTDTQGYYSAGEGMHPDAQRHGHLRGWVKTASDGSFGICTLRPAQYPDNQIEAHIHVIVKEPDMDVPYWIDAWVFDDDPLLTTELRKRAENIGGSGIMKTRLENGVQVAEKDVFLGLNIPGYPD